MDSGATNHMSGNKNCFTNLKTNKNLGTVTVADGSAVKIEGTGDVQILHSGNSVILKDVLYVPQITVNLISIFALQNKGAIVTFDKNGATVKIGKDVILKAETNHDNLWAVPFTALTITKGSKQLSWKEAHEMMGHVSLNQIEKLEESVDGIRIVGVKIEECDVCAKAKQTRRVHKFRSNKTEVPGEELSADLAFFNGTPVLVVSDTASGCTLGTILNAKSDTCNELIDIINIIRNRHERTVKTLITDNGKEFVNKNLSAWLKSSGIKHVTSSDYTPEQNGIAERKNRTIVEMMRAMLLDSGLDKNNTGDMHSTWQSTHETGFPRQRILKHHSSC